MEKTIIINSQESLNMVTEISNVINNKTFHHHYYILYDIAKTYNHDEIINYVEIGCYAGGSACLLLQRPNTNVVSIDIGTPISAEIVFNNVNLLNKLNNNYKYILGNSHLEQTKNELIKNINHIDILFIDGDHSYNGVKNDFEIYNQLVKPGGYIVFDDYNDHLNSPNVKVFVDDLVKNISDDYEIIGTLPNIFNARPSQLKDGNCFIIRKKEKNIKYTEKIGIVIPTYYRKDGSSKKLVERSLKSISNQTFQNYKVYLIGDRYENIEEFDYLSNSIIDKDKIYSVNLTLAEERDFYNDKRALWSYGGVNATNYGISKVLNDNIKYICHLDHDDYWLPNHLELISKTIEETSSPFICTISLYMKHTKLPITTNLNQVIPFIPRCAQLIHSSTCINFNEIPLRYRDIFKETGKVGDPADCILWNEISEWLKNNSKTGYLINQLTCYHDDEGYSRNN